MRQSALLILLVALFASSVSALPPPDRAVYGDYERLDPQTDTLVLVDPTRGFAAAEVGAIGSFLHEGGRVLVAGVAGSARELLTRLDVGIEVHRGAIFSLDEPNETIVEGAAAWADLGTFRSVEMPALDVRMAEVLLQSQAFTWLDQNDNGKPDLDEPHGVLALAARQPVGNGTLLVLATSAFATEAAPQPLRDRVDAWLTEDGRRVVVDHGHSLGHAAHRTGNALAADAIWTIAAGLTFVVLPIVLFGLRLVRKPTAPRRVRPLPPPRSPIEEQALAELTP